MSVCVTKDAMNKKKNEKIREKIPTKTGGASPSPSSFQNLTLRKNISALPF